MTVNLIILGGLEWGNTGPAQVNVMCTVICRCGAVGGRLSEQVGRLELFNTNIAMVDRGLW